MVAVVHRDPRGDVGLARHEVTHALPRLGDVRGEVEIWIEQRGIEQFFDHAVVSLALDRPVLGVTNAEDIKDEIVAARVNVGAENVDPGGEKGAADAGHEPGVVPAAHQDLAVALLGVVHPFDHGT